MSLLDLVENECGSSSSLIQLSNHIVQDKARKDDISHSIGNNDVQHLLPHQESVYRNVSQTFNVNSIIAEISKLETPINPLSSLENASDLTSNQKNQQLAPQDSENINHQFANASTNVGYRNYQPNNNALLLSRNNYSPASANMQFYNATRFPNFNFSHYNMTPQNSFHATENFRPYEDSNLRSSAWNMSNSILDPMIQNTQFMNFVRHLGNGSAHVHNNQLYTTVVEKEEMETATDNVNAVSAEYGNVQSMNTSTTQTMNDEVDRELITNDEVSNNLWENLMEKWEENNPELMKPWDNQGSLKDYEFSEDNTLLAEKNPLEEGKKKLEEGDITSAVLFFEAAAQQMPENTEAWLLLGTTQAENEQDTKAIAALRKCIQLDGDNLTALMALAVSYTNENYYNQAGQTLKEWILRNPKYRDLVTATVNDTQSKIQNEVSSILPKETYREVLAMYMTAVQKSAANGEIDVDVQNGLGVLLCVNFDYDRAADCFRTACKVRPGDARLWNRLGAILANGKKTSEAVAAYSNALKICPGFVRARYNLGITCMHLKAYKEACQHLLIALNQQISGKGLSGEKSESMSESIWNTLRLTIAFLDRSDLFPAIRNRNVELLSREFGVFDL